MPHWPSGPGGQNTEIIVKIILTGCKEMLNIITESNNHNIGNKIKKTQSLKKNNANI